MSDLTWSEKEEIAKKVADKVNKEIERKERWERESKEWNEMPEYRRQEFTNTFGIICFVIFWILVAIGIPNLIFFFSPISNKTVMNAIRITWIVASFLGSFWGIVSFKYECFLYGSFACGVAFFTILSLIGHIFAPLGTATMEVWTICVAFGCSVIPTIIYTIRFIIGSKRIANARFKRKMKKLKSRNSKN